MRLRLRYATAVLLAVMSLAAAGCSGGISSVPTPVGPGSSSASTTLPSPAGLTPVGFSVPFQPSLAVPPKPPDMIPARPSPITGLRTSSAATHAPFFAGESALSNGVYYLALPNGNPFGYYSYLSDPRYIYHFDTGYEFVYDANDGQGGVYFYDFESGHWWYTGRNYPFPYLYDFSLSAFLYYYPDTQHAGRYTSNPRYFYNFDTKQIITLPPPYVLSPSFVQFTAAGQTALIQVTAPTSASASVEQSSTSNAAVATVSAPTGNGCPTCTAVTVTSVAAGTVTITISASDLTASPGTATVQVATTTITPQSHGRSGGSR